MPKIIKLQAHKILNSRGNWTLETHLTLDTKLEVTQTVPEGASKGMHEAVSLPVAKACELINHPLNDLLYGQNVFEQHAIDNLLIDMDGTPNKSHLGGNTLLSISLACAKASAQSQKIELYEYINQLTKRSINPARTKFPTPIFNVLNGGKHANNNLSFQEFMVIPSPKFAYPQALELGVNVYHALEKLLASAGFQTEVGDEGGFAPQGFTASKAFTFLTQALGSNYQAGKDAFFGMDAAAESFFTANTYCIPEEHLKLTAAQLTDYYANLLKKFELLYLEDPFFERDDPGWQAMVAKFGKKLMVVADDLVVTTPKLLRRAITKNLATAVIVKPNQVGTLTETLAFIALAKQANWPIVVSHRSGETSEDTVIADLAVAVGAEFIKAGAPARGERVGKYNRLLEIWRQLKS